MKRKAYFFVFVLISLQWAPALLSASPTSEMATKNPPLFGQMQVIRQDAQCFFQTGKSFFAAPLHFQRKQWAITAAVAGATGLLFLADQPGRNFAQTHQSTANRFLFNADQFYGNGFTLVGLMGLYGAGYLLKNEKVRKMGLRSAEAAGYAGGLTVALKILFGRRRPYGGDSPYYFRPFQLNNRYNSLPSGHTTVAFAVSTVLAESVPNRFWKIFWYSAASLVAASRVYHNQHWISDVFLGAAIGYSAGRFVLHVTP